MHNPNWNPIQKPLYRWTPTIERIICAHELGRLSGSTVVIASDYSGSHKTSDYQVISALYVDLEASKDWEFQRRKIRHTYLPDGRRLSFKALNDKKKQRALIPFLEAADNIRGLSITLAIKKSIRNLCASKHEIDTAFKSFGIKQKWRPQQFETALRVAHLVGLLVGGLSYPNQNIYWISDEDPLFANIDYASDLQKMLGKYSGNYVQHQLGELGMGTTKLDEGDRFEEDLAAVPDLIAGAVSELTTRLSEKYGGVIPKTIAFPYSGKLSTKTDIITSWLWSPHHFLQRIVIIFEKHGKNDGFSVSLLNMK